MQFAKLFVSVMCLTKVQKKKITNENYKLQLQAKLFDVIWIAFNYIIIFQQLNQVSLQKAKWPSGQIVPVKTI